MTSIQPSDASHPGTENRGGCLAWASHLPAVLFNTGFAILATVTLCGIVFITKPQVVMHDIPPWMWMPLLILMAPAQAYAQFLSWRTVFSGTVPTAPAIVIRQVAIPQVLRPGVAVVWLFNFLIGFAIIVSLAKPRPGNPPMTLPELILIMTLASWFAFAANVYLLLACRTWTQDERILHQIWNHRHLISLAMGLFGVAYYRL